LKVDVLSKEETNRIRHFVLHIQIEEAGQISRIKADIIEEHNLRNNGYHYEIESFSWISDTKAVNVNDLEERLENYLIDNIDDILS
jgi:hypothetical protein